MPNKNYTVLFGPVPSRRLGISLGVDVVPFKTCSLDCMYCECGKTTHLTTESKNWVPLETITSELHYYLSQKPELDYITFSGSGEPMLYKDIGSIVSYIKTYFPEYAIALLTNGTCFSDPERRGAVSDVDLIIPSLDAATDEVFQQINRPAPGLSVDRIIEGLVALRKENNQQFWLELFILPPLNTNSDELERLKICIDRIQPDKVQLNTLDRPGTESWLTTASQEQMEHIRAQLGPERTEIVAAFKQAPKKFPHNQDVNAHILSLVKRRPCTVQDIAASLGITQAEAGFHIQELLHEGLLTTITENRGTFFVLI